MGIAVSSQRSAVSDECELADIFVGFRGWKVDKGEDTRHLSVVCEMCRDLVYLCRVVTQIDAAAVVDVTAGDPFIELTITLSDQFPVDRILSLR